MGVVLLDSDTMSTLTIVGDNLSPEFLLDAPCVNGVQSREPAWRRPPNLPILNTLADIVSARIPLAIVCTP